MKKSLRYFFLGALGLMLVLACNFGSDVVENSNTGSNENSSLPDLDSGSLPSGSSLMVNNNSNRTVCEVYVAPESATEWGEERLGTEVLDPGESYEIEISDGIYQIRANDCDGGLIAEDIDFEVSGSASWAIEDQSVESSLVASGDPGVLTIVNNTGVDVCYVFVSPAGATSWGSDWLGENNVLDSGDEETITVGVGEYDLQVANCDGDALAEEYGVDFSSGYTWTLE